MKSSQQIERLRATLLDWYDREGRTLPWRIRPEDRRKGKVPNPYAIWLSEIMCQQTTTTAVIPYWRKFLKTWPDVETLAAAGRDEILTAWAGLGYYARARNLHKCAQIIVDDFGGEFPTTEAGLLKLPGIGPYTAAAIAAICNREVTNVVDGNVERVIARLHAVRTPLPKAKPVLKVLAGDIACPKRPDDYAQALMDLGAIICKPKSPQCEACPWGFACQAKVTGEPSQYPLRLQKKKRPQRFGAVFYLEHDGHVWLRTRPDKGLLGGMAELPGTPWRTTKLSAEEEMAHAPAQRNWQKHPEPIRHVFTHFELFLNVYCAEGKTEKADGYWAKLEALDQYALPSLMRKAIDRAKAGFIDNTG
ncbi:MAG TPA: A/G-specific adenine glycosylase [Hellea balneolensis]|uniref:Adenine DNA glycosylase n=1 Tax=Hellea balneolensis TaxID=287478 RepID=A0A7C5LTL2_9PROT|nr:A/G-specific adenine glycosylase [Hellea balneolensis]